MGLDSVELLMEIENFFGIRIPDQEAEKITTIGLMVNSVANHLNITCEDTSLREKVFTRMKDGLTTLSGKEQAYGLSDTLDVLLNAENTSILPLLTHHCQLDFPWPGHLNLDGNRLIKWLYNKTPEKQVKDWQSYTFSGFIDMTCGSNYKTLVNPDAIKSKYEIYICVMGITVDKIGVDYVEIGPDKSFTDDLGVD